MTGLPLPALAISASNCTGGTAFAVALRHAGGIATAGGGGRDDLAVTVQRLCAGAGVAAASLQQLRIDRGPGSYTGLRIAVTFARTLHAFGGARLLACTSFELLALAALQQGCAPTAVLRVVLDGRRDRLLTAAATLRDGSLCTISPPRALAVDELAGKLQRDEVVLAPAALLPRLREMADARGASLQAAAPIAADSMFDPRLPLAAVTVEALEPLYLLASYAE